MSIVGRQMVTNKQTPREYLGRRGLKGRVLGRVSAHCPAFRALAMCSTTRWASFSARCCTSSTTNAGTIRNASIARTTRRSGCPQRADRWPTDSTLRTVVFIVPIYLHRCLGFQTSVPITGRCSRNIEMHSLPTLFAPCIPNAGNRALWAMPDLAIRQQPVGTTLGTTRCPDE
jgi:hypothetical protein